MKRKLYLLTAMLCLMMLPSITTQAQTVAEREPIYPPILSPLADKVSVQSEWRGEQPISKVQIDGLNEGLKKAPGYSGPTHQVKVVVECDQVTQPPFSITFKNTNPSNPDYSINKPKIGETNYNVPEGNFDIVACFRLLNNTTDMIGVLTVIREQVPIFSDTTLTFSADEAKNHITFQTYTNDGELVNTGKWHLNENGNLICLEPGNVDEVVFHNFIACKDYGLLFTPGPSQFGVLLDTQEYEKPVGEMCSGFFVNDVSERIVFNSNRLAVRLSENKYFTSNYEVQGAEGDLIVSNDPSEFQLNAVSFDEKFYNYQDKEICSSVEFWVEKPGADASVTNLTLIRSLLSKGETINLYLGGSPNNSSVSYAPLIHAGLCFLDGNQWVQTIYSPILTNQDGKAVIANAGATGLHGAYFNWDYSDVVLYQNGDRKPVWFYPTPPSFTYPIEKKKGEYGNNCPFLLTTNVMTDYTPYGLDLVLWDCMGIQAGRFGEIIPNESKIHFTASKNGEVFLSTSGTGAELQEPLHGDIDLELVLDDIFVDDIPASNILNNHFNADTEDNIPPTLTSLHFKDNVGFVTDRFENAQDGTIEFFAGDFGYATTPLGYIYNTRFQPISVEVSYSPYQADNWNYLTIEEVPENYWPSQGWFYTGSLTSVNTLSENGWFDLKFRLVDEAGNWQEQTLSPAFRIDALVQSAVTEVRDGDAHEVARYSIDGKRVDANHSGIVIIRMSDGTARKVLVP